MAVQAERDISTVPFIRSGISLTNEDGIILQDAGRAAVLAKFTLMGKAVATIPATGTADGGNTGDGTVTGVAFSPPSPIMEGDWELECTVAVANGGTFKLTDPGGNIVRNDLVMTAGAGVATTFVVPGMTFIITDGATDFIVTDKFVIAVTAVNKYVPFDATLLNGGQQVHGIYLGDEISIAKMQAADVPNSPMLVGGNCTIDLDQIVYEDGAIDEILQSGKTVRDELAAIGIFAEKTIDIDGYET
jgi:hypothetical protein